MRYTVYGHDGRVLTQGTVDDVDANNDMNPLMSRVGPFRVGYHGLLMTSARRLVPTASPYEAAVMDFEFVPPPPPPPRPR